VRPTSMTHHDDGDQRLVRLAITYETSPGGQGSPLTFFSPRNERIAPPGWWMLFLVTSSGRPSQAYWIHL
jgi:hypothetical protein